MFNGNSGVPISMNVVPAGYENGGNSSNGNGWGDSSWIIWLFFILAIFWGGFGNGGFGSNGGGSGLQGMATRADINEGFALNNLQSGINAIQQGICDATYAIGNQINGVNTNIMQSTNAIQQSINANTVSNMQSFNELQALIAQCCCDSKVGQMQIINQMQSDSCAIQNTIQNTTRDVIDSQSAGTRAILEKLSQMEYNGLNDKYQAALAENQTLRFAASQTAQNQFITQVGSDIVQRLQPNPIPAYLTCSPYQSAVMYANAFGTSCNNSCGCNSGCC